MGRVLNLPGKVVTTIVIVIGIWSTFYRDEYRPKALALAKLLHKSQSNDPQLKVVPKPLPSIDSSSLIEKGIFECRGALIKVPWEVTKASENSGLCGINFAEGVLIFLREHALFEHTVNNREFMRLLGEESEPAHLELISTEQDFMHHILGTLPLEDNTFLESPHDFIIRSSKLNLKGIFLRSGPTEIFYLGSSIPGRSATFLKNSGPKRYNQVFLFNQKKLAGMLVIEGEPRIEEVSFLVNNLTILSE